MNSLVWGSTWLLRSPGMAWSLRAGIFCFTTTLQAAKCKLCFGIRTKLRGTAPGTASCRSNACAGFNVHPSTSLAGTSKQAAHATPNVQTGHN